MRIVTSGYPFLDIDAYGGCVAYAELLNAHGIEARAVSTAPLNESITPTIRSWSAPLTTEYMPQDSDEFVVIDLSDPEFFDTFVDENRISEIIDHHPEFEEYWRNRPEVNSQIEFVGAACTLVYERWVGSGLLEKMSQTTARLLVAGVLDNTLNLKASVTNDRDTTAYEALCLRANLPSDWAAHYFAECQQGREKDLATALQNDLKSMVWPSFNEAIATMQLVLWDSVSVLEHVDVLRGHVPIDRKWFINIISLNDGKNYLVADDEEIQIFLKNTTGAVFDGGIGVTDRLWLRKEIMKRAMELYS